MRAHSLKLSSMVPKRKPANRVLIIVGPRGVGKSYAARRILEHRSDVRIAPGVVTRPLRTPNDGNDALANMEQFRRLKDSQKLCLVTKVGTNSYGYRIDKIHEALSQGKWVILLLFYARDVELAQRLFPGSITAYLRPADHSLIRARLLSREKCTRAELDRLLRNNRGVVKALDRLRNTVRVNVAKETDAAAKILALMR